MSNKYILLLTTIILFWISSASAQTTEPSASAEAMPDTLVAELDRIVITASKLPLSRRETTKPVIIIDRAELDRSSGSDISQILNRQSGIRVNNAYGSPANSRILYLQGASAQNTLILLDGKPVNDPSGVGGLFDLRLLPLHQLERIEVIKGSQSTLYGTDAVAGVINLISATPSAEPFSAVSTLSYGSFNTFQGSIGVSGSPAKEVQYHLSYQRDSSDGFSAASAPDEGSDFSNDGYQRNSLFGRVEVQVGSSMILTPYLNYSENSGDYDGGAFTDADNRYMLEMIHPGIRTEYRSGDFRIRGDYGFTQTNRLFESELGTNEFEGRFHDADLYADLSFGEYVTVLGGFNYQDYAIPVSAEGEEDRRAWIKSPYLTFYLKNLHGFSAELGYRLNRHSEYGNNSTYSLAPSYYLFDNLKLYASVTSGFKVPTPDELFGPFGANEDLDPQRSRYINAGLETYLMDRRLKAGFQVFSRKINDLIIFTFDQGYINRDEQNDRGVEVTADWLIGKSLNTGVWYNYTDGEITEVTNDGNVTRSNLIRRPKHSIGLDLAADLSEKWTVRVNGEWNGERTDLYFNPANNFIAENVKLDPYTLVNLYTEYRLAKPDITFFADVKNLLNTDFTEVYGFNTMGTALKAGVKVRF